MKSYFTEHFKRQLKRLSKKFPNLKEDLIKSLGTLNLKNEISIGDSIYKIRIIRSYLYFYVKKTLIVPLVIYPKNETEDISKRELEEHLNSTILELLAAFT